MVTVLHLSDPHFGTEREAVLQALLRHVQQDRPEVLILSGDITQRARRRQFRQARLFVDSLGIASCLAIPGNHDIPLFNLAARVLHPYANYCREFGADLEPELETDTLLVLTVNTTRPHRHKDGEVSLRQIERVTQRLRAARTEQLRIVVTHQPVAVLRQPDAINLLHGHEEAAQRWTEAGADLLLGGHIHFPYILDLREQHPALSRHCRVLQAGTALSSRVRAEADNSFNVIRHNVIHQKGRQVVHVERWDYVEHLRQFQRVLAQELPLSRP